MNRDLQTGDSLLTEAEAAARCRYDERQCKDPVRAFQRWARRAGIPVKHVGRARLYDPRILDAFLDRATWTKRHRDPVAGKPGTAFRPQLVKARAAR
jgi:hypothetical protein